MNLDRIQPPLNRRFADSQLSKGNSQCSILILIEKPAGTIEEKAGRFEALLHIGQAMSNCLVFADRLAELTTLPRIRRCLLKLAFHHTQI